ncbi:MAG TPA: hypothetical protein VGR28_11280 [Candidatus Thermoplasmatota archaeon]|jgi:hypothetical protein|nr:hypothetical protein [Candidatus Thermoplasmatota archaeon]
MRRLHAAGVLALLAAAALVAPVLAGPAPAPAPASVSAAPAAGPAPSAAEVPIALRHCAYTEVPVRVLPQDLDPLVPDDFVIRISTGLATVNLGAGRCGEAESGADVGAANFAFLLARIEEPEDPALLGPGVGIYFYRLEHLTMADDVYARAAQAAGVDRIVVDVIDVQVQDLLTAMSIEGAGRSYSLTLPLAVPGVGAGPWGQGAHWREYHAVEGGYAYLDAHLWSGDGGQTMPGVLQIEGGLAGEVYGPVNAGLTIFGTDAAVLDGQMGIVPYP